jgi:hypothetical protein
LAVLARAGPNQPSSVRIFETDGSTNPSVTVHRDPVMLHVGFSADPARYYFPADVWAFFKRHPRPSS